MITYRIVCEECGTLAYSTDDMECAEFEQAWHAFHYRHARTVITYSH